MGFLGLGQKGQAFSTFKLLIAAIVAVVILVILLSILGIINFSPRNQPIVGASDALKEAYQNQYLLHTISDPVTFTRDSPITSKALVEKAKIGIAEEQLCLSLGDFMTGSDPETGTSGFKGHPDMKKIEYTLGGSRNAKFSVLCTEGAQLGGQVGTGNSYTEILDDWIDACPCTDPASDLSKDVCCVIMLRIAR